jgi:hypothetical protein
LANDSIIDPGSQAHFAAAAIAAKFVVVATSSVQFCLQLMLAVNKLTKHNENECVLAMFAFVQNSVELKLILLLAVLVMLIPHKTKMQ